MLGFKGPLILVAAFLGALVSLGAGLEHPGPLVVKVKDLSQFRFPVYANIANEASFHVHEPTEPCFVPCVGDEVLSGYMTDCSRAGYSFLEVSSCQSICCTRANRYDDQINHYSLNLNPDIARLCNGSQITAAVHDHYSGSNISTVFRSWPTAQFSYRFFGCLSKDVLDLGVEPVRRHPIHGDPVVAVVFDLNNQPIIAGVKKRLRARLWDFAGHCFDRWVPWTGLYGPAGLPSGKGAAVYAFVYDPLRGWEDQVDLLPSIPFHGWDADHDKPPPQDIDKYHFDTSKCVKKSALYKEALGSPADLSSDDESSVETLPLFYGTPKNCVDFCSLGHRYDYALVLDKWCSCVQRSKLAHSIPLVPIGSNVYCQICGRSPGQSDALVDSVFRNDELLCGAATDQAFQPLYSVYELSKPASPTIAAQYQYTFWQCVSSRLHNDPVVVYRMAPDWYRFAEVRSVPACFALCHQTGDFEVLLLTTGKVERFGCTCLKRYKFMQEDLRDDCLTHWCPGLDGPCVEANEKGPWADPVMQQDSQTSTSDDDDVDDDRLYSAAYCLGPGCENKGFDMLLPYYQDQVCQVGKVVGEAVCGPKYHLCVSSEDSAGRNHWLLSRCSPGLVFNPILKKCHPNCEDSSDEQDPDVPDPIDPDPVPITCSTENLEIVCNCTDDNGDRWVVFLNDEGWKPCRAPFIGNQTWRCLEDGHFETDAPVRDNCIESWVNDIQENFDTSTSDNITTQISQNLENASEDLSPGGLIQLCSIQVTVLQKKSEENYCDPSLNFSLAQLHNTDILLGATAAWRTISDRQQAYNASTNLLRSIVEGAKVYFDLCLGGEALGDLAYSGQNMQAKYEGSPLADLHGQDLVFRPYPENGNVTITVPSEVLVQALTAEDKDILRVAGASLYLPNHEAERFPVAYLDHGGPPSGPPSVGEYIQATMMEFQVLGANIQDLPPDRLIEISFMVPPSQNKSLVPKCVFWNTRRQLWDGEGCQLKSSDPGRGDLINVTCLCNHLTNFAIIMGGHYPDGPPLIDQPIKEIISNSLGGISCGALLVSLLAKSLIGPQVSSLRHVVEMNRICCLLVSLAAFLYVINLEVLLNNGLACTFVTFFVHFGWLSVFSWTAVEGYLLYQALVVIFDVGSHRRLPLYAFGYGVPLAVSVGTVIVALTLQESTQSHYHRLDACWLGQGFVWTFVGPVALVLIYNAVVLSVGMRTNYMVIKNKKIGRVEKVRRWVKTCVILSTMLGLTWVFGFAQNCETCEYLFIVLNCSSGVFIFFYSVATNRRIIDATQKALLSSTRGSTFRLSRSSKSTRDW